MGVNGDLILAGTYYGRVLELVQDVDSFEKSSHQKMVSMIVLIEDQVHSFKIKDSIEISAGSFISFKVNANCLVENIQIEQIPYKFRANGDVIRWRSLSKNPSRMEIIRIRHKLMRGVRKWFDQNNFIETETPFLVNAPNPEAQISPVRTDSGFLITSPEFQMKRLLVGGFEKIYQLARCFRSNEIGPIHNPEFTMLEWYRTREPLDVLINDLEQLIVHLIKIFNEEKFLNHVPPPPWPRVKVKDMFKKHLDIVLDGSENAYQLMEKINHSGFGEELSDISINSKVTNSLAYEQIFSRIWNKIVNEFSKQTPIFVYEWPKTLASLANHFRENPRFVNRVELYVNGIELANGFSELTDIFEQRERFKSDINNRLVAGFDSVPLDEKFLKSIEQGLPRSSGMALGVDRLIMWICSLNHIRDVLCFADGEV